MQCPSKRSYWSAKVIVFNYCASVLQWGCTGLCYIYICMYKLGIFQCGGCNEDPIFDKATSFLSNGMN